MKKNNRKGFTIVELVIVIAVIAILAAVLIPTFSNMLGKANESAVLQEAKNMYTNYVAAIDYAAGEVAERNALVKVVKGEDTFFVKVDGGSVVDEVHETQPDMTGGSPLIEADNTAESGVTWEKIPCADGAHVWNDDNKCNNCGVTNQQP